MPRTQNLIGLRTFLVAVLFASSLLSGRMVHAKPRSRTQATSPSRRSSSEASSDRRTKPRVFVRSFTGSSASRVRAVVVKRLSKDAGGVEFVAPKLVTRTASRSRLNVKTADGIRGVSEALRIDAWVSVSISAVRGVWRANIEVLAGADPSTPCDAAVEAKTRDALAVQIATEVQGRIRAAHEDGNCQNVMMANGTGTGSGEGGDASSWMTKDRAGSTESGASGSAAGTFGSSVSPSSSGASGASASGEPSNPSASVGEASSGGSSGVGSSSAGGSSSSSDGAVSSVASEHGLIAFAPTRTPLELTLGVLLFSRSYDYTGDDAGVLRPYSLGLGPAVRVSARWFPGAHFTDGVAAHVGLAGEADFAFGLKSKKADGSEYPTKAVSYLGQLLVRLPVGDQAFLLGGGLGRQSFSIGASDGGNDPEIPSVGYSFVRLGVEAQLALLPSFPLRLGGGYRFALGFGDLADDAWFPAVTGGGLDAFLQGGLRFAEQFQVLLGVEVRRYSLTMHSDAADVSIAEGASDLYLGGTASFLWQL